MLLMFEGGIREGVSMITTRHAKAHNPCMGKKGASGYDPDSQTKYITYLDANNLYGWALCKPLPVENFERMKDAELGH